MSKSVTKSVSKMAGLAAGAGVALSLALSGGIASAVPDLGPIINSTCTYPQVMAALNDQNPDAAAKLNSSPEAQGFLTSFIAAPPDKRERIANQIQAMPQAQQYFGVISQIAGVCHNY